LPIGLMFTLIGAMLAIYGLATNSEPELYGRSLGINVNLRWGLVLLPSASPCSPCSGAAASPASRSRPLPRILAAGEPVVILRRMNFNELVELMERLLPELAQRLGSSGRKGFSETNLRLFGSSTAASQRFVRRCPMNRAVPFLAPPAATSRHCPTTRRQFLRHCLMNWPPASPCRGRTTLFSSKSRATRMHPKSCFAADNAMNDYSQLIEHAPR